MTKLLKTALKSMRDRQRERKRDRQIQIQRRKRERETFTRVYQHYEVVHSKHFQRKRIRTYWVRISSKIHGVVHFQLYVAFLFKDNSRWIDPEWGNVWKKPWWEKISCNFAEFQFNMLHFNIKKGGKLDINVSSSTLMVEQINMFSRKAQTH